MTDNVQESTDSVIKIHDVSGQEGRPNVQLFAITVIRIRNVRYQTSVLRRAGFRNVGVAERVIYSSDKRNTSRPTYFVPSRPKFMVFTVKRACMNFKTNTDIGNVSLARK